MSATVSRTLSVHQEHEFLLSLETAGLLSDDVQRVIGSRGNALAKRVVDFVRRGGYDASTDYENLARVIMGENFLGIEEVTRHFGVSFTQKQAKELVDIPFTEAELQECRSTHLLVAGYPLSFPDVRKTASSLFYRSEDAWYDEHAFATDEKVDLRWYLVRKDVVDGSTEKTWDEQQAMLAENEETPRACEFVYSVILYALATGIRLFPSIYGRAASEDTDGRHVYIGSFGADGLRVHDTWDAFRWGRIGVLSSRSFNV